MKRRSLSRPLYGLLAALVLGAGWLFFGPTQVGGSTSYVVIVGSSMEPLLHRGDLAIIRSGGSYAPGDVVLYKSHDLSARVLHRITRVQGDRFGLKGDNNDFVDSEHPLESQFVGKLWLNVPQVGIVTDWVRKPVHAALLMGLATLLALGGGAGLGQVKRRRRSPGREPQEPVAASSGRPLDLQPFLLGVAGLLVLSVVLAVASFTQPTVRADTLESAFVQQGSFTYSADVAKTDVYPDGRVVTGEPIFLKLVPRLRFAFAYEVQSQISTKTRGRIGLVARLTDGRGWERKLVLARQHEFTGRRARVAGTLDLRRLQSLIDRIGILTGSSQAAYSLTILPRVELGGRVGSAPLDTTFTPVLGFDLGDLRLQADLDGSSEGVSPFAPREAGTGTHEVANKLSLAALAIPVQTARRLSLIGLVAALLLGLLLLAALRQRFKGDETARIQVRYGHLLLPVTSRPQDWARVTELADIESLVRLAEHHDRMILHLVERGEHSYVVEEGAGVYRYRTRSLEPPATLEPRPSVPPRIEGDASEGAPGRRFGTRRGRLRPDSSRQKAGR